MASSHLQVNHDASTEMRPTQLWPNTKVEQKEVIIDLFEREGWIVQDIENIGGAHWEVITQCQEEIKNIDLYISSIRDESRQDDEFKMQLGNYYPSVDREGWTTLILGIYTISESDEQQPEYLLACYNRSRSNYNYGSNPSHRGVRTKGLKKAKMYGYYENDQCCIFKPEMVYYCIEQLDKGDYQAANPTPNPQLPLEEPLQQIYYGAPGTGKSHKTSQVTSEFPDTVRITFHPDSDYSTFVGAYKPTMISTTRYGLNSVGDTVVMEAEGEILKERRIEYKFVKQAFLKAYVKAWQHFKETCDSDNELMPQFLVIEEINRGNCAQIFGDLFQLLDRKNGFSEYPIEADEDIRKSLLDEDDEFSFGADGLQLSDIQKSYIDEMFNNKPIADKICNGQVLVLPPNLYIWGTMNTSDQSLFPIDSAFKRRWEWKYMKIKEGKDESGNKLNWQIVVKDKDNNIQKINGEDSLSWWSFIQKVNDIIASMTSSADKQLGYFFCKAKNGIISGETFVSKVIFYLWNDVFKDYGFDDASLFRYEVIIDGKKVEKDLTFPDFYDEEGEHVDADRLADFLEKVMTWQKPDENA